MDLTPPAATYSGQPNNPTNDQSIDMTVGGAQVVAYKYKIDGEAWSAETAVSEHIERSAIAEGAHTIYIIGRDAAGNWQAEGDATTYAWSIDITPPTAVLDNTPANPTNSQSIDVTVGGTDVESYRYKIDGGGYGGDIPIATHIMLSGLAEGAHTISVIAKDDLGNEQSQLSPTTHAWTIDITAPTATLSNTPPLLTSQTDIDIDVGGADVAAYRYRIDGDPWSAEVSDMNTNITAAGLVEGSHSIYVIGRDSVGNWQSSPTQYDWTIDLTAATATLSGLPASVTNVTGTDINVGGTNVTAYRYRVDGGAWLGGFDGFDVGDNIVLAGLADGEHTIEVIGADNAFPANWQSESDPTSHTWTVDTQAPTASLSNTPADPTNVQSINISVGGAQVVAYRYQLDGGGYGAEIASGTPITAAGLAEGSHTVDVIGRDQAGNWQDTGSATSHTWEIDVNPPIASLNNLPVNPTNSQSTDIDVGGSGVAAYKYRLDAGGYGSEIPVSTNIQLSGLSESSHTIYVIGRDEAGNWQAEVDATTHTWTVDITPPTASFTSTPPDPDNDTTPAFTVGGAGVVSYRYRLDGGAWSGLNAQGSPINLSGLTEDSHTLDIVGRDQAGNEQSLASPTSYSWDVDLTAPEATLSGTPASPTNSQSIDVTVGGTDVQAYMYRIDGEAWSGETAIGTHIIRAGLAEGSHTLYVVGKDSAGNWQDFGDATSHTWTIDISPPTATLSGTPPDPTNQTGIDVTVGGADVVSYSYRIDGGAWSGEVSDLGTHIVEGGLAAGPHTLEVIGKDSAGNWQATGSATTHAWDIDLTATTAVLSNTPANPTNATTTDITVGGTDVVAYDYRVNGGGWSGEISSASNIQLSGLTEGGYTLEVIAKDSAGNWQAVGSATTHSWTVDLTPPTATLSGTPPNPANYATTDITVGGAGVTHYQYKLDGGAWSATTAVATHIQLSGLSQASHTLYVIGRDLAGNWQATGSSTNHTWTVDTTPPSAPATNDNSKVYDEDLSLYFQWTNGGDVAEVKIQVSSDSGFSTIVYGGADGASVGTAQNYTYTIDPSDGATYYARVKVRDAAGNWSGWGAASDGITVVGHITGKVLDTTKNEVAGATVTLYRTSGHVYVDDETTDGDGEFTFSNIPIGSLAYEVEVSASGYHSTNRGNISSTAGVTNNIGIIYLVSTAATAEALAGRTVDANTGADISGATIVIKDWSGNIVDTLTPYGATFTTDPLDPGAYTLVFSKLGYFDLTFDNIIADGTDGETYSTTNTRYALCEILVEPHVRVIVQWGPNPRDYDLHVVGPTDNADTGDSRWDGAPTNRFHVYWSGHKSWNENTGRYLSGADPSGTSSTTSLVQDDTDGYGPEAINLFGYGSGYDYGIYTYTVHKYTSTGSWHDYPVTMRVFDSQGLVEQISVPSTDPASNRYWKALKINCQGPSRAQRTVTVENTWANFSSYSSKSELNW